MHVSHLHTNEPGHVIESNFRLADRQRYFGEDTARLKYNLLKLMQCPKFELEKNVIYLGIRILKTNVFNPTIEEREHGTNEILMI